MRTQSARLCIVPVVEDKMSKHILLLAAICSLMSLGIVYGCNDGGGDSASGGGCGNPEFSACTGDDYPEGWYVCDEITDDVFTCIDGKWEHVVDCNDFVSGGRSCTCKGGCASDVECSFAFDLCTDRFVQP